MADTTHVPTGPNVTMTRDEAFNLLVKTAAFSGAFQEVTKDDGKTAFKISEGEGHEFPQLIKRLREDRENVTVITIKGKNEHNLSPEDCETLVSKVDTVYTKLTALDSIKQCTRGSNKILVVLTEGENFHEKAPYTHIIKRFIESPEYTVYAMMCKDPPADGMVSANFHASWAKLLEASAEAYTTEAIPVHHFGLTLPNSKSPFTYGVSDVVVNLGSSMYKFKPDGVTMTQGYTELAQLLKSPSNWKPYASDDTHFHIFERVV